MASFVSRLVACLVAVVAVLQLVHLVLLNKLESTRLHELRRLQEQQQQYHHQKHHQHDSPEPPNVQETGQPIQPGNRLKPNQQQQWGSWRSERSAVVDSPDVPEQEILFDHLLREDQGAVVDSTGEFRIVFDVAGPRAYQSGSPLSPGAAGAVIEKEPAVVIAVLPANGQTDDFSIDDENFEGAPPPVDVTLVTFGDLQDIKASLIPLVSRWNGPMSVSIFAPNAAEVKLILQFLSQARSCHGPTRQFVSFHLVFPLVETHSKGVANNSTQGGRYERWRKQNQTHKRLNESKAEPIGKSCQSLRDQINKYYHQSSSGGGGESRKYFSSDRHHHIVFPANLLRNVARRRVTTEYSFVINVDMIPSRDLRASFQHFARERIVSSGDDKKTAFVVPAFEIKSEEESGVPEVKSELLRLVDKHKARPFQFDLCWKCQMYTEYETWQKDRSSKGKLKTLFEVLWKDPWEPFFIADNSVPLFDERFRYSNINRMSQLCELHVAGYKFAVLNEAFLVHRGYVGGQARNGSDRARDVDTSRAHFRQFKTELKDKYPHSTRRCY